MASSKASKKPNVNPDKLRHEWLSRLSTLIDSVQRWAEELGWSTRRIEKQIEDLEIGTYNAPALLMQEETTRVLLEPIARSAPGADGIVDLYRMPAYDDIASLYFYDGGWHLQYASLAAEAIAKPREAKAKPFSKRSFQEVLEEMKKNGA